MALPDARDRLYTFDDFVMFLDGLGCLPNEVGERNDDAVESWIEHMDCDATALGEGTSIGQEKPLGPPMSMDVKIKVGSALVHYEEGFSPCGAPVDIETANGLAADPAVMAWRKSMGALLPVKRSES